MNNDAEIRAKVEVGDGGGFVKLGNNIKNCDKQAEFLKFKIDDLRAGIEVMESMPKDFAKAEILQAKAELEKLENQYAKLTNVQEVSSDSLSKGMAKGVKSIKRFGLSLFGIQSIWRMVSKASSAYMAQDSELANKMQATWVGLGSFLAPLLEQIANFVVKAVKYLDVFITALTGKSFLANAMAKSIKKVGNAGAKASKQLAGFDEITNLGDNASGIGGMASNWADAFKDTPLDDGFVEKLKNIGKLIRDNKEAFIVLGSVIAGAFAVSKLSGFISAVGVGGPIALGLAGILTVLGLMAADAEKLKKEIDAITENNVEHRREWAKSEEDINRILSTMNGNRTAGNGLIKDANSFLAKTFGYNQNIYKTLQKMVETSKVDLDVLMEKYKTGELTKDQQFKVLGSIIEQHKYNQQVVDELKKQGKSVEGLNEITGEYEQKIGWILSDLIDQGYSYDDINKKLGLTKSEIDTILAKTKPGIELKMGANTTSADKSIDKVVKGNYSTNVKVGANTSSFKEKFKKILSGPTAFIAGLFGDGAKTKALNWLNSFRVGTDSVPNDGLAYLHKGERVIPKSFNSAPYVANSMNNDRVVELLSMLNNTLENKDYSPVIDKKAMVDTVISGINHQNRVMGKGVF